MATRFQIPLYKLFIVVAIFAVFFRVRSVNGQDDVAYTVLAAIAGVIVSLYILFHRSRAVTIGVVMIMGAILGLAFAQPARYRAEVFVFDATTVVGATVGACIGACVGILVALRRKSP